MNDFYLKSPTRGDPIIIYFDDKQYLSIDANQFDTIEKVESALNSDYPDVVKVCIDAHSYASFGTNRNPASKLPGIKEYVLHPVYKSNRRLDVVIINLNDDHKWSREQIADWLDTLDIDLAFKERELGEVFDIKDIQCFQIKRFLSS